MPVQAQDSTSVPTVVQSRPVTVRGAGLNGAGAALVGTAGAIFNNPAGIATIRHIGLEGAFRTTPSEGRITAGAFAWRLRQFDLGVGITRYRSGISSNANPIPGVPASAEGRELAGVGSLVYRFGIIAVGGSGKYVQRTMDGSRESALSGDAGLAVAIFDIMAIGFSMQNIGGRWGGESTIDMPQLSRVAMMWNYVDPLETFRLLSTVEFQWPEGEAFRVVLGGEGGIVVSDVGLFARAAYGSRSPDSSFSRMTYGGSLMIANMAFDYAYQSSDLAGEPAHRFGLRLTL